MKYLLDTHTLIWLDNVPRKLSADVVSIIGDLSNQLLVSVASIWEMQIKLQVGKLSLPTSIEEIVERQREENRIELLPIEVKHIVKLADLPDYHKDPFDRLLIAQAMLEEVSILSTNSHIAKYPVRVIW